MSDSLQAGHAKSMDWWGSTPTAAYTLAFGFVVCLLAAFTVALAMLLWEVSLQLWWHHGHGVCMAPRAWTLGRALVLGFAIIGPPIGVFGSIVWVMIKFAKGVAVQQRADLLRLKEGECIADRAQRRSLLSIQLAFAKHAECLGLACSTLYIFAVSLAVIHALVPPARCINDFT